MTRQVIVAIVVVGVLCVGAPAASGQSRYVDVHYRSGGLRIQAYLYKPDGGGPFPAVIYNHGSRAGRERQSVPFEYIGELLNPAGYVVLVSERRGYGNSDGPTWPEDVGNNRGRVVARLERETDDVLAAVDYLRTLAFVDARRIGIMGWSFGGIVTMFAVSRSTAFAAAVDQAGGALTWNDNAGVRGALVAAAEKTTTPTLLLVAENDRTTDSITTLDAIFGKRGVEHRTVIYPPFVSQERGLASAPAGHRLFSAQGVSVWRRDVLDFFARYLRGAQGG
jgi:dienelactone hydrolase